MAEPYATAGQDLAHKERPLESISSAVQRVNTATVRISSFIDRFHGAEPSTDQPPPGIEPGAIPYSGSLDRLFAALDRLETRVEGLDRIG